MCIKKKAVRFLDLALFRGFPTIADTFVSNVELHSASSFSSAYRTINVEKVAFLLAFCLYNTIRQLIIMFKAFVKFLASSTSCCMFRKIFPICSQSMLLHQVSHELLKSTNLKTGMFSRNSMNYLYDPHHHRINRAQHSISHRHRPCSGYHSAQKCKLRIFLKHIY